MRSWWIVALVAASGVVCAFADDSTEVSPRDAAMLLVLIPGKTTSCTDVECMIDEAYAEDPKARVLALELFRTTGSVAGVGPEEVMDGGYRGKIQLVPQLPTNKHRKHLEWTVASLDAIDTFFVKLYAKQPRPDYRWRSIQVRFVRSVGKRTPSAYAFDWTITYNVNGSLLTSSAGVLETLFHEMFHLNDFGHGDWSARRLQTDYDAIVEKCGTKAKCYDAFAPNTTKVRATGMYYAFQQNNGNGVHEYAAELAVRYFREQSQMLNAGRLTKPAFKCGPPENVRSWQALVDEFFGGRDLVPAC
jgi:hypothetical protein